MIYELISICIKKIIHQKGCVEFLPTNHLDEKLADSVKKRYTTQRTLDNGLSVTFRPIECTDQAEFKEFFKALSPASVHFRFLEIIKDFSNETVERYCNIDYNQEMAIVALPIGGGKIIAVARLILSLKDKRGEFSLVIADASQGFGLGKELLAYLIKIAGDYQLEELYCVLSSDNYRMIGLAEKFGLKVKSTDGDTREMTLKLA
jgi:acetyltransferase